MSSFIKGVSYYLPEKILTNQNINEVHPEWSADKISRKTGIFNRHIAGSEELSSDMAIKAAEKLFDEYQIDRSIIDFVLLCTQSPDYFLPTTACILQDKLGLSTSCGAIDYNLGCSGYIYGLALAKGLVESKVAKNVLLITAETYSKFIHPDDKSNKTIFGDAAAATLISAEEGFYRICDFSLGTDGSGAENLIVKDGGARSKTSNMQDQYDEDGNFIRNEKNLYMNGSEIFSFTSIAVPKLVDQVIEKNKLSFENIDYFLFHQANKYMLDYIRRKIDIPEDKFLYFLENVGNTVSSTIPIALKEQCLLKDRRGRILLAGFGVGYSWGGCLIETL